MIYTNMVQSVRTQRTNYADIFCLTSVLLYALGLFNHPLQQFALWILLPSSCIVVFFKTRKLLSNSFMTLFCVLVLWSGFTALFAINTSVANMSMIRICGVFMFCYVITFLGRNYHSSYAVALIYFVYFINCIIYAKTHILNLVSYNENFRLNDENLNANTFAYFTFFVSFLAYHLAIVTANKSFKKFWRIIFLLLIPLTFYLALLTASRQILLLQVPYFCILLYHRYWYKSKVIIRVISVVAVILCVFFLADDVVTTYDNSYLAKRSQINLKDDTRSILISEAIETGMENPLMGIGPNNFQLVSSERAFAHNSYLELFADSGIVATLIYLFILLKFIYNQYRVWVATKSETRFSFLIFGVFYTLDNFFYVFYVNPWLMGILAFITSTTLSKNNRFSALNLK